jgi:hypothetical protein
MQRFCQILTLAMALLAAGCTTGLRTTYLPNGQKGYSITCKGYLNTWESCLIKAGRICGSRGYDTLHSDEFDRNLLIGCKSASAAAQ